MKTTGREASNCPALIKPGVPLCRRNGYSRASPTPSEPDPGPAQQPRLLNAAGHPRTNREVTAAHSIATTHSWRCQHQSGSACHSVVPHHNSCLRQTIFQPRTNKVGQFRFTGVLFDLKHRTQDRASPIEPRQSGSLSHTTGHRIQSCPGAKTGCPRPDYTVRCLHEQSSQSCIIDAFDLRELNSTAETAAKRISETDDCFCDSWTQPGYLEQLVVTGSIYVDRLSQHRLGFFQPRLV